MKLTRFLQYLREDKTVPVKFKSGQEFYDFCMNHFKHDDTYVECQGHGSWYAEIGGDSKIKSATYDAASKQALWFDAEGEDI